MKIKQTLTKSLNYLIIAGINWLLLLVLAVLSTDEFYGNPKMNTN
ncbi:MAG: hypothetical protein QM535_06035 [Limnohabitans sp.]|nr:hypothetical protein [Limnohabitans sp.]